MTETPPAAQPTAPLKMRIASAIFKAVSYATNRRDGTVNRRILKLLDFNVPPDPTPVDGVATSDHTVDPARNLKIRLFSPSVPGDDEVSPPLPVVVYFHGGGFVVGSAFSLQFDSICRRLSRQIPALVASAQYRLAPEHRFPAAYEDGLDVLRWLDSGELAPDLSAVFIAGDSAGGNIAHHVARRAMRAAAFERMSVVGVVEIQPFYGGEEETESERRLDGMPFASRKHHERWWRAFLPVGSDMDHDAANVFGPGSGSGSEDWAGFPATMVAIGGLDSLQDRQRRYCEGLKGAGVDVCAFEYPNSPHGFHCFPELPESRQLFDDVAGFVRRRLQ